MFDPFNHNRQERKQNNRDYNQTKSLLHKLQTSKKITCIDKECRPKCCSNHIERKEMLIAHFPNSCYKRGKSPYNRNKPCIDNRFPTMLFVEVMSLFQMLLFDSFVFSAKDFWSKEFSDFIVYTISNYCGSKDDHPYQVNTDSIFRISCQGPSSEKQRISR